MAVSIVMKFQIKSILGMLALAFALNTFEAAPALADGHLEVIKERKALMKTVSKSNKVIKRYKKGKASAEEASKAAKVLLRAMNASIDEGLYPKGSTRPDVAEKETRAKAKVISEWDNFVKAGKKSAKRVTKFIKLVEAGTGEEVKFACGGCHKPYRGKKVK
jgi:cytochrome c556